MSTLKVARNLKKTFYDHIQKLPDDIKTKIYTEYFEPIIKKKQMLYLMVKCNTSCENGYNLQMLLIKVIKYILTNEHTCAYVVKMCHHFNSIYHMYYLKNELSFPLIADKYAKFTAHLLTTAYH